MKTNLKVEELIKLRYENRITEPQAELLERMLIAEMEMNDSKNYAEFFKDRCAGCGAKIPATWENYRERGNYCRFCNIKTNQFK